MRGATLIEVLVAFLLLAFGILGLSGLQINAQKNNQISLQRSQASMLACFLIDSMRANRKAAINGDYNLGEINKSAKTHTAICNAPTGTALVGNPQQVAERIREYQALGITNFIFSGYPHLEEAIRFAELVFPLLPLEIQQKLAQPNLTGPFGEIVANSYTPDESPKKTQEPA